jgi:hypothetical protein
MERTQISLTTAQAQRLRRTAAERGVSMASLVREAIDTYVSTDDDGGDRMTRARAAAGRFSSGVTDISDRHDEVLAEDPAGW